MRVRPLLLRLLLLGCSVLVSLALAEVAVRLVRPQPVMTISGPLYAPDPPRRYRLRPGFVGTVGNRVEFDTRVAIDRAGLRSGEIAGGGRRDPGTLRSTLRILALGDSFTFGVGAEAAETYPARLQEILRARGLRAEVLNGGAPGYGVPDEVAWFARWGKPLAPDVVLVTVFIGNDLQDAAPGAPKVTVVDGALVAPGESSHTLSRWLYYHSHLFVLLKSSSLGGALRRLAGRPEPLETRELRAEFALYAKGPPSPMVAGGAAATEAAVAGLVADAGNAKAGKTKILAVLIPSLVQVDPRRWEANLARFALDPSHYDRDRPNAIFRALFARHGVPVLDLTPTFASAIARGERIYFPIDQHLTPAGYQLTARQVAAAIPVPPERPGGR
jgi:lysophospholipase L1-like esterase